MTRRRATRLMLALLVGGLMFADGSQVLAQKGPGQTSAVPMQQMAAVIRQMADRLASGKGLDAEKAERLRRLTDQLVAATDPDRMARGAMGQGAQQMGEFSRILTQMQDLLRGQ